MNDILSASSPLGKRLLNEGFNPSGKELSRSEALKWTISTHHLDIMRQLIADGTGVNAEDKDSDRPIHDAARIGACEEMRVLYEAGATIDIVNKFNVTPLHRAALGNEEAVQLLVDTLGAQVDPRDCDGWTPFVTAATHNYCETLKLLRGLGADVQRETMRVILLYTMPVFVAMSSLPSFWSSWAFA
ncbi:ankyrin repeat-containing domain protein [Xylaria venustula]|nr:ankyrin repeat-containing domain protein [Xylaria venustula]